MDNKFKLFWLKASPLIMLIVLFSVLGVAADLFYNFSALLIFDLSIVLLAVAAIAVILLLVIHWSASDVWSASEKHRVQNENNQAAILRLLDEITNLAQGDLTVKATVTEHITGAIADSINYAIDALRALVATINKTAVMLDSSARQVLASSGHLAKASDQQAKQVSAASESVEAMAASIEAVSGNAARSAEVARHSVDVAHKGTDAVRTASVPL